MLKTFLKPFYLFIVILILNKINKSPKSLRSFKILFIWYLNTSILTIYD